jgi:hypothetical protein
MTIMAGVVTVFTVLTMGALVYMIAKFFGSAMFYVEHNFSLVLRNVVSLQVC